MSKWTALSLTLLLLTGLFFSLSGTTYAAQPPEQKLYKKAADRLARLAKDAKKRRYRANWERCISDFDKIIRKYPKSPSAGNALYSKAEGYAGMYKYSRVESDLDAAVETYHEFLDRNPKNAHARDARAKLKVLQKTAPPEKTARPDKAPDTEATPPSPGEGLARISGIRHWSNTGYTRVVIDMDGKAAFTTKRLKKPDRLCFDIKRASIAKDLKDGAIEINDGILKTVRASQYDPETVRVVLDLQSIASQRTLMLSNPSRLVVDVTGIQKTARKGKGRFITLRSADGERLLDLPPVSPATSAAKAPVSLPFVEPDVDTSQGPPATALPAACVGCIVIDPGHGGHDSGAVGPNGLKEKDVVLDIGIRLRAILQRELGCRAVMTRDSDVFIDLDARPGIAVKNDADLFISIHANASRDRRAKGIETYLLNLTRDRDIMEVAARENMTSLKDMGDLDVILKDLILDNKRDESLHLAHAVQAKLVGDIGGYRGAVNDKGVKQGPFLVLYGASMPSVLTEVGFISNPEEEELLASQSYRQKVAEAIFDGIRDYISNPKVVAASAQR